MTQDQRDLATLLEQETVLMDALLQVLTDEKEALSTRQFEALEALSDNKQSLSSRLEDNAAKRMTLIGNSKNGSEYQQALRDYLNKCTPEQAAQIDTLNKKLGEQLLLCREYNAVNGQVIAANINTRQEILHIMSGQEKINASNVYTATGDVKNNAYSERHQKA